MKTVAAAELEKNVHAVLGSAQSERIILTRGGKPSAVLVGIEGYDEEDMRLAGSSEFWSMIQKRRLGRTIPLEEVKNSLKQASSAQKQLVKPVEPTKTGKAKRRPRG
jgi:antitoxin (DNA-binding transcriptional repressor) of toxin-antitoxin stability system